MPFNMPVKLLTSSLVFGTMAGGSIGIFKLTNKNNFSQVTTITQNLKEMNNQEVEVLHTVPDAKDVDVNLISTNEKSLTLKKSDEKINSRDAHKKVEEIQKPIIQKLEEVKEERKTIERFENNNLDLSNQFKNEEDLTSEIKEREEQKILLETVWIRKDEGITQKQKSCTLLRKDQNREIPNIMNASDEKDDTCDDYETVWSDRKQLIDHQDGLWIRGEGKAFRDVISENWDDLLIASGFTNNRNEKKKDIPSSDDQLKRLEEAGFCKITKEGNNEEWMEISCEKK